ncbi:CABIT domain-containing protein [Caerostris darwini]|uniref:CABIT domain-containing protein n=1 Tax=Caerostris darwini TaxID=1538125 RepID=A0AAV4N531_9ARAC|nr:CABIT domain-containing protein [Caerostris darwini]
MNGTTASTYLAAVKWDDEDFYLQELTQKFALPQVARITKGQYMNLGVPSLSNPSLNQIVLFTQAGKRIKVAAQCVKFKDGSRVVPVGTKLSIPDNYEGWFEILSEDGRAVRCIESVAELLKRFPETCLVRENIKAYLAKIDDAEVISDKTRTINAGETLILLSEVHVTSAKSKSSGRYLRCFTTKGETIFFNLEQKGKFSPIAGEENISGVHTIKNLSTKRFPLMVRLVHGKPPTGIKTNSHFVTEMRLYSLFEEECIMALPLLKDSQIIALPPSAPLKVQAPRNTESLIKLKIYDILVEKCKSMVQDASDKIQVFDISLSKEIRSEKFQPNQRGKHISPIHRVQRSVSDPNSKFNDNPKLEPSHNEVPLESKPRVGDNYDEIDQIYDYVRGFAPLPVKVIQNDKCNGQHSSNSGTPSSSPTTMDSGDTNEVPDDRPEPPPVETIPVRRMSKDDALIPPFDVNNKIINKLHDVSTKDSDLVEGHIYEKVGVKRDSKKFDSDNQKKAIHNGEKLFIPHHINHGVKKILMKGPAQNRIQHKSKFFKHSKSSPALKDAPTSKGNQRHKNTRSKSLTTSPLFNIRYKSLINLAIDFDTLDSSNSGDKASFGSGGSKEQKCERKSRLQRPKSLIDIFGEVNEIENFCKHRHSITNGIENRKLIFSHESVNGKLLNGHHNKRIGTLYL